LVEALTPLPSNPQETYVYDPVYWQHGLLTEQDCIYVTTQNLGCGVIAVDSAEKPYECFDEAHL